MRINLIFEGTNEILRAFIALSGLPGPGQYLKEALQAIREPIKGFGVLTGFGSEGEENALSRQTFRRSRITSTRSSLFEECARNYRVALNGV